MARSRRRTPIFGNTCAESEAWNKRHWHGTYRRRVKQVLRNGDEVLPHVREVSNVWSFAKDGKRWWADRVRREQLMRK